MQGSIVLPKIRQTGRCVKGEVLKKDFAPGSSRKVAGVGEVFASLMLGVLGSGIKGGGLSLPGL